MSNTKQPPDRVEQLATELVKELHPSKPRKRKFFDLKTVLDKYKLKEAKQGREFDEFKAE